ncbi:AAA family ATPase [Promicromonospora iranensis]|uniref:UvrD-like helicase ATP-binding domain-containing protein n=1 Tax=Promicromonospora iranensis TaxID=1105144 RepID=A0ABU2CSU8_9MICO|nr:AAA family ATPase [Promicromonospora iranensis]MDR7384409.1 hypothetical protein [Promicromonospora iranensis]
MDPQTKTLEIENERAAEKRYVQMLSSRARQPVYFQGARNTIWTGDGLPTLPEVPLGFLVGRVSLVGPREELGGASDFYIGERHLNLDGQEVFSWAAPVACTYFRGFDHHEFCEEVAVVRSFAHGSKGINDIADDVLRTDVTGEPFRRRGLSVPAPPAAGRARPGGLRRPGDAQKAAQPPGTATEDEAIAAASHATVTTSAPAGERGRRQAPALRAESLLRSRLAAPRTKSLAPVLSTLQPDQYTLVTLPAMESVVIEGQPGTGKTIVASHRAAYMINDDTPLENSLDKNVLLVGPTDAYSDHVRGVVDTLSGGSDRVIVRSLPSLMARVLELKLEPKGPASRTWRDVDEELGKIALKVIFAERQRKGITPTTQRAYEALRLGLVAPDVEWATYLRKLPAYDLALTLRAHIPLLAFIRWTVAPARELQGIEHVMVDEAQDATALEWMLLAALNEADAWTILGDLNQRRSDHTLASWKHVAAVIEYPDVDLRLERLERGYRSTLPILEYANRLLRKEERALLAFQKDGPAPVITRAGREELAITVRSEVDRLLSTYPKGTVAVIDVDPSRIRSLFRNEGWQARRGDQRFWDRADRQVVVLQPDEARGLEFDGVVVSEPADFPENFGRRGPLYTSLTRPNRELAVVHSKPLPEELRPRKR